MADKYCDHGLYGAAVVVGSTSGSSTTLTVASVTSGRLGLGAMITGTGITAGTYISALGTGKGGAGTYTMSAAMTIAGGTTITASMGGPALEPEWGVAQEGDGTAIGASTPATVSIDMSTWVFNAGYTSTVSIMGGTAITCTASATTSAESATPNAQYSAALTTMIDNLVTAINWHGANAINIPSGWAARKIRDQVFARRNGNSLELMTRSGSTSWNTLVAATFTNVTNSSSQSWASGASGAWGYIINGRTTIFPSSIAAHGYGIWVRNSLLAGLPVAGDVIYMRTARSGIDVSVYSTSATSFTLYYGSSIDPITYVADNGVKWSGESGILSFRNNNSSLTIVIGQVTGKVALLGFAKTGYTKNFQLVGESQYLTMTLNIAIGSYLKDIEFMNGNDSHGTQYGGKLQLITDQSGNINSPVKIVLENVVFRQRRTNYAAIINQTGYSFHAHLHLINPTFIADANTVATTGSFYGGAGQSTPSKAPVITIDGGRAVGYVAGSTAFSGVVEPANYSAGASVVKITNFDFGNVNPALIPTFYASVSIVYDANKSMVSEDTSYRYLVASTLPGRPYVYSCNTHIIEWNPSSSWPTLNAVLPETYGAGLSAWVYRIQTVSFSGLLTPAAPIDVVKSVKFNTTGTAVKTFTMNALIDVNIDTPGNPTKKDELVLEVQYIDSTGALRVESSFVWGDAEANLAAGSSSWSVMSYDIASVRHDYNAHAVTLTTSYPVAANTEIFLKVKLGVYSPTVSDWLFIDPEILMS